MVFKAKTTLKNVLIKKLCPIYLTPTNWYSRQITFVTCNRFCPLSQKNPPPIILKGQYVIPEKNKRGRGGGVEDMEFPGVLKK